MKCLKLVVGILLIISLFVGNAQALKVETIDEVATIIQSGVFGISTISFTPTDPGDDSGDVGREDTTGNW